MKFATGIEEEIYIVLQGPYLINGQLTMNGLGAMVEAGNIAVQKHAAALTDSQKQVAALKAELDQVKATLARIEQTIAPAQYRSQNASVR